VRGLRGLGAFSQRTLHQADRHNILFLASALTFDALLASIPFLLLVLVGLTHIAQLSPRMSAQDLHGLLRRFLPAAQDEGGTAPFALIENWVLGLTRVRTAVSLYALPLFLWFATRLFGSVRTALTLVYDVPRRGSGQHFAWAYLAGKLRDAMMVLLTVILVMANATLLGGLRVLNARGRDTVGAAPEFTFLGSWFGQAVTRLVAFGFSISIFYVAYRHASPRRLPRPAALLGSVFTALLFELAKRAFGWYLANVAVVNRFSADANIGAVILFVLWLYYTGVVFLIGAVVAETWDLWSRQRRERLLAAGVSG